MNLFVAADKPTIAYLQTPIADGDKVKARQGLCQTLTGYSAERVASVEPITPNWWEWSGANPVNEVWKEEYAIAGVFTNRGGTPIHDFEVTIFEDVANVGSTSHGLVEPSQSVPGATAPLKKDWQWFTPGTWVVKGPTYRMFRYRALISAKDISGNPYPQTTSADLIVYVNVSKEKRTAGAFAMGAAFSAAVMAASIFLIIAAAAAYGAAAAAGAVALDPPEPDPNFRDRVPLPPLGDVPAAGPERNVIHMFRLGERVMLIELAKSVIEGRRLGALAAEDQVWVETHTQDLAAATALQQSLVDDLRDLAPQAKQDVLALVPPGTDLRPAREQLKTSGLTPTLAAQMQLPQELESGFDALLRSDVALPDPDIIAAIDDAVSAITEFAETLGP
jgi:hypothetical protein